MYFSQVGLSPNKMRLFYHDKGEDSGIAFPPEELKINSKQLYTINVHSGDEFIVEPKVGLSATKQEALSA